MIKVSHVVCVQSYFCSVGVEDFAGSKEKKNIRNVFFSLFFKLKLTVSLGLLY